MRAVKLRHKSHSRGHRYGRLNLSRGFRENCAVMLFATPRRQAAAVVLFVMGSAAALLWGCSGGSGNSDPGPIPLSITTTSLSAGQIMRSYSSAPAAPGGTLPHSWKLSAGTLPAGL